MDIIVMFLFVLNMIGLFTTENKTVKGFVAATTTLVFLKLIGVI